MKLLPWLLALSWFAAQAQDFPSKPVRIVVPWPPSGNVDITARAIAPALGEALGQQVIVENRAGAAGRIGSDAVKDFVPVGGIQSVPIVLTVAPKTPTASYQEYVALAKKKDGQLSIASAGNGSSNHLAIELLMRQGNLKPLPVPYK